MTKKKNKDELKPARQLKKDNNTKLNTVGLLQVFVLVSIVYSTYVVAMGTDGYIPKVMLVPQALYAGYLLVVKFMR